MKTETERKRAERFEDLIAGQQARELTKGIYQITTSGSFVKDFGLREQTRRAAVSVMSNLAEGFERGGRSELHQFLSVAKSSCAELRSHLYVALDARHIDTSTFRSLIVRPEEVARIIGGLRASVHEQRMKNRSLNAGFRSVKPQPSALSPQS